MSSHRVSSCPNWGATSSDEKSRGCRELESRLGQEAVRGVQKDPAGVVGTRQQREKANVPELVLGATAGL